MITYYIENSSGTRLELESRQNYRRQPLEFKAEKSIYPKLNQFGVVSRGSFKQSSKEIELKFDIVEESVEDYYYQINRIASFLYDKRNSPFYLYSIERGSRAKISIVSLKENFSEGFETVMGLNCSLILTMEDSLWESISEFPQTNVLFSGDEFEIDLREDTVDSAAIFKIKNLSSTACNEFALQLTNGDTVQNIIVKPSGFTQNKVITIDCFDGTIKLQNQYISNSIVAGGYFALYPGINKILYESPTNHQVEIETKYRLRRVI